ncbi:hypothetical protein CONPUDRAFT_122910 [Coniophora puteana RWD-64-598 SS2]|uniref:Transcription factor IIIC subunit 5 HTH domain-containing protein n=1 Tax=Coniophora puteana (strain RWD-64-598) TaxID=741705 RepID=A0A5M3MUF7_CONPW|nr:uncharacterized protein CONPUDRAFT_122910 [Coniophora puteana RWD-64-598 SS2]EIW82231.1 hypothetical protein CONPUDRAFT_122910 [Coniophora puteana RWD-64-598 SS2]
MTDSPEAGPSGTSSAASAAPQCPLPKSNFYSVEYPGYVSPGSEPSAIHNLGGNAALETAFRRPAGRRAASILELRLRPDNPFAHPIPGEIVSTSNLVLKVVKRRRKAAPMDVDSTPGGASGIVGDYTAEVVGITPKTARFRNMADYQFQPDMEDPMAKLRLAMDKMDVDAIRAFRMPEEKEDYIVPSNYSRISGDAVDKSVPIDPQLAGPSIVSASSSTEAASEASTSSTSATRSNLRLFPPPIFSRQGLPQNYYFKANPASVKTSVVDEVTGEERTRLVNRQRWKGYGPSTIAYSDPNVPQGPHAIALENKARANEALVEKMKKLLEERPIWTRAALYNQLTPAEVKEVHNSKPIVPLAGYVFQDGPWRDTIVRFGYDPRKQPSSRIYQRVYFRNANHPMERISVNARRQEPRASVMFNGNLDSASDTDRRRSHIFDGKTLTKETAAFQLCDIVDPMLREMIESEEDLREECDERDGWYSTMTLERIKIVLRHKFFALLDGHIATDEECEALLDAGPPTMRRARSQRLKPGKHNMAKGAMRPEDAAAARLQAQLERNAKSLRESRLAAGRGEHDAA